MKAKGWMLLVGEEVLWGLSQVLECLASEVEPEPKAAHRPVQPQGTGMLAQLPLRHPAESHPVSWQSLTSSSCLLLLLLLQQLLPLLGWR